MLVHTPDVDQNRDTKMCAFSNKYVCMLLFTYGDFFRSLSAITGNTMSISESVSTWMYEINMCTLQQCYNYIKSMWRQAVS